LGSFPALLLAPLPRPGQGETTTAGPPRFSQTFSAEFGPEVGDWQGEQLVLPKFNGPAGSALIRAEVETCGQTIGVAQFQNLDETSCLFSYEVTADILMEPVEEESPVADFTLALAATGGPFPLSPGEIGSDVCDSGLVCTPVQVFTERGELAFFYATPADPMLEFDHQGVTSSEHTGCGVVDFHSDVDSMLSVRVTYVYELGGNRPPVCMFGCDPIAICDNGTSTILLDAHRAFDPEKQPITYEWRTDCPNSTLTDPTGRVTLLIIDHGGGACTTECDVQLTVSDGELESVCSDHLVIP
jgi:hypothetical protein